uniref:Uncharacterized protein n=1 Tax=Pararge aegeria TaxID=116150 RepID=S4NVR5_9NEOP
MSVCMRSPVTCMINDVSADARNIFMNIAHHVDVIPTRLQYKQWNVRFMFCDIIQTFQWCRGVLVTENTLCHMIQSSQYHNTSVSICTDGQT